MIVGKTMADIMAMEEQFTDKSKLEPYRLANQEPTADMVNRPPHYNRGGIECIDAIAAASTGLEGLEAVCTANAIKYLWRWKHKNGVQDLEKARWYISKLIETVK